MKKAAITLLAIAALVALWYDGFTSGWGQALTAVESAKCEDQRASPRDRQYPSRIADNYLQRL